jgi:hypothetical protein
MDELDLFRGDTVLVKGKRKKETVSCFHSLFMLIEQRPFRWLTTLRREVGVGVHHIDGVSSCAWHGSGRVGSFALSMRGGSVFSADCSRTKWSSS